MTSSVEGDVISYLPWISIISKNVELVLFDFVFYKECTLLLIKCNYSRSCSQDFHFSGFNIYSQPSRPYFLDHFRSTTLREWTVYFSQKGHLFCRATPND